MGSSSLPCGPDRISARRAEHAVAHLTAEDGLGPGVTHPFRFFAFFCQDPHAKDCLRNPLNWVGQPTTFRSALVRASGSPVFPALVYADRLSASRLGHRQSVFPLDANVQTTGYHRRHWVFDYKITVTQLRQESFVKKKPVRMVSRIPKEGRVPVLLQSPPQFFHYCFIDSTQKMNPRAQWGRVPRESCATECTLNLSLGEGIHDVLRGPVWKASPVIQFEPTEGGMPYLSITASFPAAKDHDQGSNSQSFSTLLIVRSLRLGIRSVLPRSGRVNYRKKERGKRFPSHALVNLPPRDSASMGQGLYQPLREIV